MKKAITLLVAIITYFSSDAQVLKGKVRSQDGQPLVNSTIMLLDTKDSSMLSFGKSKEEGLFEIKSKEKDLVLLQVSHMGFKHFYRLFTPSGADQDLGIITLDSAFRELAEVTVKGEKAAIEINKDTIEFNAGSFKVQENAMVEDLLKRLPGMEVGRDGSVTAQGKSVTRLLVDGKEFFGRDPKMGTKNIPANAIDKIQVFDKKSDRAEFTGIDDGEEERTINLKLREDKKNLGFGRLTAGGGIDANKVGRYNLAGTYNTFKKGNQFSLIGNANNINQQSFSMSDFGGFTGMGRNTMGGGAVFSVGGGNGIPLNFGGRSSGLMRNISAGINFNNKLNTKSEINGSYSYTNNQQAISRIGTSESIINDLRTIGKQNSDQDSGNESHRMNVTLNSKLNAKNNIRWVNRVDYRNSSTITDSDEEEFLLNTNELRNSSERSNKTEGASIGYNTQLLYQKSFDKKGRSLTANLTFGLNNSDNNGRLLARNGLFNRETNSLEYTNLNQISNQFSNRLSLGADLSYTEPLNRNHFLEFNYAYQKVNNDLDKKVYNISENSQTLDSTLSNQYENDYIYNRGGISYRVNYEKWNANVGASIQDSRLKGNLILTNELIDRTFINPVFNGRLRYLFTSSRTMDLNYNTNISEPSMTQLSPVPNNSNPLNIYVGNPNLKPQYSQRLNLNFRDFNQISFTNFFVMAGVNYTNEKITNEIIYDEETLAQTRRPINYGNDLSFNGVANYGFRVKSISTRFSLNSTLNYSRSLTLINNVDNVTKTTTNANMVRADFTPGDNFNLGVSARVTINNSVYSQNNQLNPSYVNQDYTTDMEWRIPGFVNFTSALDYSIYRYASSNVVQRIPLLNASVYKTMLKGKKAEIRLSVNDILGRNQVISQTASENTFTEQRTNALGRYFLASFTYNINGGGQRGARSIRVMN